MINNLLPLLDGKVHVANVVQVEVNVSFRFKLKVIILFLSLTKFAQLYLQRQPFSRQERTRPTCTEKNQSFVCLCTIDCSERCCNGERGEIDFVV